MRAPLYIAARNDRPSTVMAARERQNANYNATQERRAHSSDPNTLTCSLDLFTAKILWFHFFKTNRKLAVIAGEEKELDGRANSSFSSSSLFAGLIE